MEQEKIGLLIATKRKERQLTQEQLAGQLGVTNKAVSKWENGKCMPDLALIQPLCEILDITVNELLNGEENSPSDELLMHLMWLIKKLEKFRIIIIGLIVGVVPYVLESLLEWLFSLSSSAGGESEVWQFFHGLENGLCAGMKIIGIVIVVYGVACYSRENTREY